MSSLPIPRWIKMPQVAVARLRDTPISFLGFVLLGAVAHLLWTMPTWSRFIEDVGVKLGLYRYLLPDFISTCMLTLMLRASVDRGSDMTDQPFRFVLRVAVASSVSVIGVWLFEIAVGMVLPYTPGHAVPVKWLLNSWLNTVLFGGLFGWLSFLHLGRIEADRKFSALLIRHSFLARQVAQSRLAVARARIDPEMVARALREIRSRYRGSPESATEVLEHLIAYLRLAMNRNEVASDAFESEIALLRAYIALRTSETGTQIVLQLVAVKQPHAQDKHSLPLFAAAQGLLEEAIATGAKHILLCIESASSGMIMEMKSDAACPSAERVTALKKLIESLAAEPAMRIELSVDQPERGAAPMASEAVSNVKYVIRFLA